MDIKREDFSAWLYQHTNMDTSRCAVTNTVERGMSVDLSYAPTQWLVLGWVMEEWRKRRFHTELRGAPGDDDFRLTVTRGGFMSSDTTTYEFVGDSMVDVALHAVNELSELRP